LKQLETGLVYRFKMLKTMLSEKLKLEVGPLLTILSYLFKQLEKGLVCNFKMLKTMLSEKLKLEVGPLLTILTYLLKKSQITFLSILCGKITLFLTKFTFPA
jgi:hypothetical protein